MRLQIALTNLVFLVILLANFHTLKDSKKMNAQIFFWIMVLTGVVIVNEYVLYALPQSPSMESLIRLIRAIYYILMPIYPMLSALYAETWMYGVEQYSKRFLFWISFPLILNGINIISWFIRFNEVIDPTRLMQNMHGKILLLVAFYPLVYTWIKMALLRKRFDQEAIFELFVISLPVALGGIIQTLSPSYNSFWSGAVISQTLAYFYLLSGHALKDTLTSLGNRRELRHDYKTYRNNRKGYMGGLLIDVDRFKSINDGYGHSTGDEILIEVAQLMQRSRHSKDGLYRLGGDEFLMLVMLENPNDIYTIKARLEENLRYFNQKTYYPFDLGLSIGAYAKLIDPNENLETFLDELDKKMYEEKQDHHRSIEETVEIAL